MGVAADAYVLEGKRSIRRQALTLEPREGEAVVEVLACGLCHTDLGFADGSVAPKRGLPIVLGHEIVGTHNGKKVLVPAVIGCGRCAFCDAGRDNACPNQIMPGNDSHGGFASHVVVPAHGLVPLDDAPPDLDLRELSVVSDAVATAYQATSRAGLSEGDLALVVGVGGVGGFLTQIARARGARVVVIDVDRDRLDKLANYGTAFLADRRPAKELRKEIGKLTRDVPTLRHRIFECSGTAAGQQLAYALIGAGATMVQVGYCREPIELRLSNLMAFDATVHGTWGAPLAVFPEVLRLVFDRKVVLTPFVTHAPMSRLDALLDDMAHHRLGTRAVLDPRT